MRVVHPRHYATEELLRDGGSLCIRAIRPDDQERLLALFEGLSSRSVYFRFFQAKKKTTRCPDLASSKRGSSCSVLKASCAATSALAGI